MKRLAELLIRLPAQRAHTHFSVPNKHIFFYKQQVLVGEFMKRGDWKVFFYFEFFNSQGVCLASFQGYVH